MKLSTYGISLLLLSAAASVGPALAQDRATLSWGYNSYGMPGMIDMPTAFGHEDAELATTVSSFAGQTRSILSFQISKRLTAAFRYSFLYDLRATSDPASTAYDHIFDRSFSVQYRLRDETDYLPAFAIGLNDIVGTGIYGGEYIVATKTVTPTLRATLGLGWGRYGSVGGFSNPLSIFGERFKTRPAGGTDTGAFDPGAWFHGDAAFFGGLEWLMNARTRMVLEYSSDAYAREDGLAFDRRSPFNLGVEWQASDKTTIAANYLYGSELGLRVTYALNPKRSSHGSGRETAPPPVAPRYMAAAASWGEMGQDRFRSALTRGLEGQGLALEGLKVSGRKLSVGIRNTRYGIQTQALGRTARILTQVAPAEVEVFEIILSDKGIPVTSVTLRRQDIETLEFHSVAPDLLRVNTIILDAPERLPGADLVYPRLEYGLSPYLLPSLFDPDSPFRADAGIALTGRFEPVPGLVFSGRVHQKIVGNLDQGDRVSTSVLPHVRSDAYLYYKESNTTVQDLTVGYYFRPAANWFGRVTLGYLEAMYGGVSAELLWKPQNSALALSGELNYVKQRDFNQLFGFQDYEIATGHLSAYYEFGGGYTGQLDVGRYLAGDIGATVALNREFDNGWRIGAFATVTDVSRADFGEGSFDKGIRLSIPQDWVTGKPSRLVLDSTIRPVQRDGGARVNVPGRLYETVRGLQSTKLDATWGRFWK